MRSTARRCVESSLVVGLLFAVFVGSVVAHDEACELALRDAPIEEVPALPGWEWREVMIGADGWRGQAEWFGRDLRAASFAVSCVVDPAGLFERRAEVRRSVRDEVVELDGVIGDETVAWRSGRSATTHLEWRSGDMVGTVVGEWNASVGELAAMAEAFETALSSGVTVAREIER